MSIYVTTTIPYVNARPHVGFALELVQADALARYHRLRGRAVRLQTGTDDNALSNVLSARAQGIPIEELVERNSTAFRRLCVSLDVSADRFIRTSEPEHVEAVHRFLGLLRRRDVFQAPYRGRYCPRCEDFFSDAEAIDGRCPEHGAELDRVEETNYFFRLSAYQEALEELIGSDRLEIVPGHRKTEVLRFIESGLRDFSISRAAARASGWGVPFPGDSSQVVYVWVDALVNYLTGTLYADDPPCRAFWTDGAQKIHVVGKNVWKFHAVYWPALLLSAGHPLPDRIFVHGFLTESGRKISKSAGTASDPQDYISTYGADAVRHFLLAHVRAYEDADFSRDRVEAAYRELANTLGNLVSRLTTLCERAGVAGVAEPSAVPPPDGYEAAFECFRFDAAAGAVWSDVVRLNREIADRRPWEDLGTERQEEVALALRDWVERLAAAAHWLRPFLPKTADRILRALTAPKVSRIPPLFPRLDSSRPAAGAKGTGADVRSRSGTS